jgi:hypothetical protein
MLAAEMQPAAGLDELLAELDQVLTHTEIVICAINPAILREPRWVGRLRLPTTAIGLLTHIAEHTQRHLGQAISAKLAQAAASQASPGRS